MKISYLEPYICSPCKIIVFTLYKMCQLLGCQSLIRTLYKIIMCWKYLEEDSFIRNKSDINK